MDEVEEEMRAQQRRELVHAICMYAINTQRATLHLMNIITASDVILLIKETTLDMLATIMATFENGRQILEPLAQEVRANAARERQDHPDGAWVDRELEGIQDAPGDERSDETA